MDNQVIVEKLKVILATVYSFGIKAQNYHWNVTGPHFIEYHRFFQEIYEQIHADVDMYAEQIRILGSFAPGSLSRFAELSRITDETSIPVPREMIKRLEHDNAVLIGLLKSLHTVWATQAPATGVVSLLEDRISYHKKLAWKLESLQM